MTFNASFNTRKIVEIRWLASNSPPVVIAAAAAVVVAVEQIPFIDVNVPGVGATAGPEREISDPY